VSAIASGRAGRKPACPPEVVRRMYDLHFAKRLSYHEIAVLLNAEGVPMPCGGQAWTKSSVVRVMTTTYGQAIGHDLGLLPA
jgi:hypothetical protein